MTLSDQCWKQLRAVTPLGGQTLSKLPDKFVNGVYPKVLSHGKGAFVYDLDGKSYVDMIAGLGCISVGYANDFVNECVMKQVFQGVSFSLPNMVEARVAEKLCELVPFTEMWKYSKNGTDATLMAIRCARAFTGRSKILTQGYHGCTDHFECLGIRRAGMVDMSAYTIQWDGKPESITSEYAALIIEPMIFDRPSAGYLKQIQDACREHGVVFILDEVVTGGRFEQFCASNYFDIEPDLICLGKALANGFPLAAVGGKRDIMATYERDDFFASGTFFGECVSLAASLGSMAVLEKRIPQMVKDGTSIKEEFNALFPLALCKGYPTRLTFDFPSVVLKGLFMQEMCKNGVLIGYSNSVMADYNKDVMRMINLALHKTAEVMNQYWANPSDKLEGDLPREALRKR